jgi:hypothetical protein
MLLCDRLWGNTLDGTLGTSETIATGGTPLPARDRDGATAGNDVLAALEYSVQGATDSGGQTLRLTYTNSAGVTGHVSNLVNQASPNQGNMQIWPLAAGDKGVKDVTAFQNITNTFTLPGTIHVLLFRILAIVPIFNPGEPVTIDGANGGLPKMYDGTVPFLIQAPMPINIRNNVSGYFVETQG